MRDLAQLTIDGGSEWVQTGQRPRAQRSLEEIGALTVPEEQGEGQEPLITERETAPAARSCERCRSGRHVGTLVAFCSRRQREVYNITACDCSDWEGNDERR